ncbi:response regulator transcription factor [Tsuneonella sp. SYSU-LHT278]|uniref:response regulator transcription factor n=1 Tax=Tsuneonella sediminis TaxID=3416089 RepID=UPI003F7985AE
MSTDDNIDEMTSSKLHVVEPDPRRRAKAAFDFSQKFPSQVYESIKEFIEFDPPAGVVIVNDDCESDPLPELHAHFARNGKVLPIALYSEDPRTPRVVEAVLSGAVDYLDWPLDSEAIEAALDRIVGRFASHDQARARRLAARSKVAGLSKRERGILQLMIDGNSNKQIAQILDLSPRTVEVHRANVLKKLDASSTADAVRIGLYAGLEDENRFDE